MIKFFVAYIVTLMTLILGDGLWLKIVAKSFYERHLGFLLAPQVSWMPIAIFYLMFAAGLVFFAVAPALATSAPFRALILGAFLGLLAYATYNLTNQAMIANWPLVVTLVDTLWGVMISACASFVGALAAGFF